jgi:hypothetical protein
MRHATIAVDEKKEDEHGDAAALVAIAIERTHRRAMPHAESHQLSVCLQSPAVEG